MNNDNELNEIKQIKVNLFYLNSFIKKFKEQNTKYKKQIVEMENFLKDYGLKWVREASKHEGEFNIESVQKELDCTKPIYKNNLPKEIDMTVIARRIDELNIIMGLFL